jgi:hypothetical protein
MLKLTRIQYFQLYSLEMFRSLEGFSGKSSLEQFENEEIFTYLEREFERLHTRSRSSVLMEIRAYRRNRLQQLQTTHDIVQPSDERLPDLPETLAGADLAGADL